MPINYFNQIFKDKIIKGVVSNPLSSADFRRINIARKTIGKKSCFQLEKLTQKQSFTENIEENKILAAIGELVKSYRQFDFWSVSKHYCVKISKKGRATLISKNGGTSSSTAHNRKKNYILDSAIPPLCDLGIFTKDGKIVNSMYDKYKQINRFTELISDVIGDKKKMTVLDFGCGKSYLTFILYHYLVNIKGIDAEIIGLDLKEDVIENCNRLAEKYGYEKLHFEAGDIGTYEFAGKVDMVITLHACDTATDFALYNAVKWNCGIILSVPCCQHELNGQIHSENFSILSEYGIIKERFSALATDAIRGNLLTAMGYRVQIMEFVDMAHSPKNILIRAVKSSIPSQNREQSRLEAEKLMREFNFSPTLYNLLYRNED